MNNPFPSKPGPPAENREFLLIDLSNSFTKIALARGSKITEVRSISTPELTVEGLREVVGGRSFEVCVLSSVVPAKNGVIEAFTAGKRLVTVGACTDLGLIIDLPEPSGVGADRLVNAAYAAEYSDLPVVVVDFGTAATFDVVAPGRRFIGGVIAPGLDVMTTYLHEKTSLLPKIDLREPVSAVGKRTEDAMMAGVVYGYRGLVQGILDRIRKEVFPEEPFQILATGGYATMLEEQIPRIIPNLTIEGLLLVGKRLEIQ